jgi:hypothetical protein
MGVTETPTVNEIRGNKITNGRARSDKVIYKPRMLGVRQEYKVI